MRNIRIERLKNIFGENYVKFINLSESFGYTIDQNGLFVKNEKSLNIEKMIKFLLDAKRTELFNKVLKENDIIYNSTTNTYSRLDGKMLEQADYDKMSQLLKQVENSVTKTIVEKARKENLWYVRPNEPIGGIFDGSLSLGVFMAIGKAQGRDALVYEFLTLIEQPNDEWVFDSSAKDKNEQLEEISYSKELNARWEKNDKLVTVDKQKKESVNKVEETNKQSEKELVEKIYDYGSILGRRYSHEKGSKDFFQNVESGGYIFYDVLEKSDRIQEYYDAAFANYWKRGVEKQMIAAGEGKSSEKVKKEMLESITTFDKIYDLLKRNSGSSLANLQAFVRDGVLTGKYAKMIVDTFANGEQYRLDCLKYGLQKIMNTREQVNDVEFLYGDMKIDENGNIKIDSLEVAKQKYNTFMQKEANKNRDEEGLTQ